MIYMIVLFDSGTIATAGSYAELTTKAEQLIIEGNTVAFTDDLETAQDQFGKLHLTNPERIQQEEFLRNSQDN